MSKNNYGGSEKFQDTNKYCSVQEFVPQDKNTKKCMIVLPGLMYRTHFSTGNLQEITKDNNAAMVFFDYPKTEFNIDNVVAQISDYIRSHPYDDIILMGLSFGEIVARQVIDRLSYNEKSKIKHHISINGVSTSKDLSVKYKTMLALCKIKSGLLNNFIGGFGIVDRKLNAFFTKSQVYNKIMKRKIKESPLFDDKYKIALQQKRHQKSASLGFTPGYVDRARHILQEKNNTTIDIPSSIIYSNNDEFYGNPKKAAENIAQNITAEKEVYEVDKGGHIALVEIPEQYNPVIENILKKVWDNNVKL